MANTFKNAGVAVGTGNTTIYTTPGSTTSVIHAIYFTNVHASADATIDVWVTDTSAGSDFYISKNVKVLNGTTLILDKPVNLETGDILKATSDTASAVEGFLRVLEIT